MKCFHKSVCMYIVDARNKQVNCILNINIDGTGYIKFNRDILK